MIYYGICCIMNLFLWLLMIWIRRIRVWEVNTYIILLFWISIFREVVFKRYVVSDKYFSGGVFERYVKRLLLLCEC